MRHLRGLLALFIFTLTSSGVQARPVSYPDGWTFMQTHDADSTSLHLHYSPNRHMSVGYKAESWRDQTDWQFHGMQLNWLVKRWNRPASQANIYLKSGLGMAYSDEGPWDKETTPAAFTGLAMDWEDRRFLVSYENRLMEAGDISRFFSQRARVGVTPYVGDYGDLHSWLMLQVDHHPAREDVFTVTPLLRLFKGPYMAETGVSDRGDVLFNVIIRF